MDEKKRAMEAVNQEKDKAEQVAQEARDMVYDSARRVKDILKCMKNEKHDLVQFAERVGGLLTDIRNKCNQMRGLENAAKEAAGNAHKELEKIKDQEKIRAETALAAVDARVPDALSAQRKNKDFTKEMPVDVATIEAEKSAHRAKTSVDMYGVAMHNLMMKVLLRIDAYIRNVDINKLNERLSATVNMCVHEFIGEEWFGWNDCDCIAKRYSGYELYEAKRIFEEMCYVAREILDIFCAPEEEAKLLIFGNIGTTPAQQAQMTQVGNVISRLRCVYNIISISSSGSSSDALDAEVARVKMYNALEEKYNALEEKYVDFYNNNKKDEEKYVDFYDNNKEDEDYEDDRDIGDIVSKARHDGLCGNEIYCAQTARERLEKFLNADDPERMSNMNRFEESTVQAQATKRAQAYAALAKEEVEKKGIGRMDAFSSGWLVTAAAGFAAQAAEQAKTREAYLAVEEAERNAERMWGVVVIEYSKPSLELCPLYPYDGGPGCILIAQAQATRAGERAVLAKQKADQML
jgi:hypothetical protein